jgi:NADPH2:quinone reductase
MKAIRYHRTGGPEVLQLDEIAEPTPGVGEALIRIEASGVNFADTIRRSGKYYPSPSPPLPFVPGGEVVGTVTNVGPQGDRSLIGKRVFALAPVGGYAEMMTAPLPMVFPMPSGIDPARGVALLVQGLTAALLLKQSAEIKPGQSIFVEGAAGGVGTFAIQLAKIYGAGTVIGGASTEEKREFVRELGADHAIDYRQPGFSANIRALTGGLGVSAALNVTGQESFDECIEALRPCGRLVVFGAASGRVPTVSVERLFEKSLSVNGMFLGTYLTTERPRIIELLQELCGLVTSGRLQVHIGGTYPLAQAADAHRALESGKTTGKLILLPI